MEKVCDICGTRIPADSPTGACPVCALQSAFTGVDDLEGKVIGPYTIIEQIGRGGFGVVYLAGQSTPVRRHVALKVLSRGSFDERMKEQFVAEQQTLALMSHPNIAKIFDAGETEWGMPYFVMELIEGEPITRYCDRKKLTPKERIEIFRQVCSAIQHAHQKAIIHRDIKPANILIEEIDDRPVPRVIDFGVAKAMGAPLADLTFHLRSGRVIGTPEYMPPEQARGDSDIDTRADIYSLGVLLYELLIGAPPFSRKDLEQAGIEAILNKIENDPPPSPSDRLSSMEEEMTVVADDRHIAPSKLRKLVRGDLDWIVMKALEKPRKLRYSSAGAFATDLDCYLDDRPLPSRRGTISYRARKFVRRNRLLVSSVTTVAAILVSASLVGLYLNKKNSRMRADRLLETLVNSRVQRLPIVLAELRQYDRIVEDRLQQLASDKESDADLRARAQMALVEGDPRQLKEITEWLLQARPEQLNVYLSLLEDHHAELTPIAWETLLDEGADPARRLNAAAICARFEPDEKDWEGLGDKLAAWLVSFGAVDDPIWLSLIRPKALQLVKPLRAIYKTESVTRPRSSAATALAEFLKHDPDEMVELLETARGPYQLAAVADVLARDATSAETVITRVLATPLPDPARGEKDYREAAEKKALLGLALLEIGQADQVWPLFFQDSNPELRTQLIHGLAAYDVNPAILISHLESKPEPGIVSAILSALGDYDLADLPASRQDELRATLETHYAESDKIEVRSAAEWLLRSWKLDQNLAALDQPLLGREPPPNRDWSITPTGEFTLSELPPTPPGGFEMGSPKTEEGHSEDGREKQQKVQIERRVAIATKEVNSTQFMEFAKELEIARHTERKEDLGRASVKQISLKEAALYCWWLSKKHGIPQADWCYEFPDKDELSDKSWFKQADPTVAEGYLEKHGYRLPTEAEWEFACRGGTSGPRYFGTSRELLTKYAWTRNARPDYVPVQVSGLLRPNRYGLFDTLGNVTEWCQDRYRTRYDSEEAGASFTIKESFTQREGPHPDGIQYVYRGGSFLDSYDQIRAAWRQRILYPNQPFTGFRIARTLQNR